MIKEIEIVNEQQMLAKLYELQDIKGYKEFFGDLETHIVGKLILRLEQSLEDKQDILG